MIIQQMNWPVTVSEHVFVVGPASVNNLSILSNTTTSLSFRWAPPDGEFDGFDVFLYNGDESLHDQKLGMMIMQDCSFHNLRPGTQYKVVVQTRSGDQTNDTFIWARTGEQHTQICQFFSVVM